MSSSEFAISSYAAFTLSCGLLIWTSSAHAADPCSGANPPPGCDFSDVDATITVASIQRTPTGVRLAGNTTDPDKTSATIVDVTIGGIRVGAIQANLSGSYAGTVPARVGSQVCARAINQNAGTDATVCRQFPVSLDPFGHFDSVTAAAPGLSARGWAIDPDTTNAIQVRIHVDGALATTVTATAQRADVAAAYPAWGGQHGFEVTVPASPGQHEVCAYAVHVSPGAADTNLGCIRESCWTACTLNTLPPVPWGQAGDIPVPADYDGDERTDIAVWRPSSGQWFLALSADGTFPIWQWGQAGDVPAVADYDNDGRADRTVWRPSTGEWFSIMSADGQHSQRQWGQAGDVPVPADYDNDGRADLAVWRPNTGEWWIVRSRNGLQTHDVFGQSGDVPMPADYDRDRAADLAVYDRSEGTWYVRTSTGETRSETNRAGETPIAVMGCYREPNKWSYRDGSWFDATSGASSFLGQAGDIPVPGNYDGEEGTDELAVWRPSTGQWLVSLGSFCIN